MKVLCLCFPYQRCGCPILSRSERVGSKMLQAPRVGRVYNPTLFQKREKNGAPTLKLARDERVGHPAKDPLKLRLSTQLGPIGFGRDVDLATRHPRFTVDREWGTRPYFESGGLWPLPSEPRRVSISACSQSRISDEGGL